MCENKCLEIHAINLLNKIKSILKILKKIAEKQNRFYTDDDPL